MPLEERTPNQKPQPNAGVPRVIDDLPHSEGGRQLFPENVQDYVGLLDEGRRARVNRVIFRSGSIGLSWPTLFMIPFMKTASINFPNAEFIDHTGLMELVNLPSGNRLQTDVSPFRDQYEGYGRELGNTIVFKAGEFTLIGQVDLKAINAVGIGLPAPQNRSYGDVSLVTETQSKFLGELEYRCNSAEEVLERTLGVLRTMGFSNVPERGRDCVIQPSEFSSTLNTGVASLESEIIGQDASGMPVVLINAHKKNPKHFSRSHELTRELEALVGSVPAAYIVNTWNPRISEGEVEMTNTLEDRLRDVAQGTDSKVLDVETLDKPRLAAAMHLTRKTNGCTIGVLGGPAILARFFNTSQVIVEIEERKWSYLADPESTLLDYDNFEGKLVQAVKKQMSVE